MGNLANAAVQLSMGHPKVATAALFLLSFWGRHAEASSSPAPASLQPGHDVTPMVQEVRTGSVTANGLRFSYLESGEGPLVLLLHGFPDDAHTFDDLLPVLARAGYHAVAPFMRGYAPSEIPKDGDYSALTLGRDVLALVAALGAREAVIVGHDWGASAGYAAANLEPARVSKLVTLAIPHPRSLRLTPPALWRARHFVYFQLPWAAERIRARKFRYLERLYRRWSPRWTVPADQLRRVSAALEPPGRLEAALGYYRSAARDLGRSSTKELLRRKVSVPTLTLAGAADGGIALSAFGGTLDDFTGPYDLVVVPQAGHFLHREQPDLTAATLLAFLQRGDLAVDTRQE